MRLPRHPQEYYNKLKIRQEKIYDSQNEYIEYSNIPLKLPITYYSYFTSTPRITSSGERKEMEQGLPPTMQGLHIGGT